MHVLELARVDALPAPEQARCWRDVLLAFVRESALAVLVVASVAVASVLLILIAFVAMPLAALLVGWLVWRSGHRSRPPLRRLRARWGRGARVVAGGAQRDP
jgi:Flp pilus assembly protein TadB